MARVIDISEKLNYEENPKIKVKDVELEVQSDAETMLKVLGMLPEEGEPSPSVVIKMYELIFDEKTREKISKMKLNFNDFATIVYTAINLISGGNDSSMGE